jgi:hypothetical protein
MTSTFTEPDYVLQNRQKRALAAGRPQPCGAGVGRGLTCQAFPSRLFVVGHRCSAHEPQPINPTPDPTRTAAALRPRAPQTGATT